MGIGLLDTLSEGISYQVEFYLSLQDSLNYAVKNVGVHFSQVPHPQNLNALLDLSPQISYMGSNFLTDKEGWMRISGNFTAQGGERYIAIGNFDDDANTDTLFVQGGGSYAVRPEGYWDVSGYFIDDVSVIPDSIYLGTGDYEDVADSFNLYPNPNSGLFTVDIWLGDEDQAELHIWNVSGQLVAQQVLSNGVSSISLEVSNGLYLYGVTVNGERRWTGKISVTP